MSLTGLGRGVNGGGVVDEGDEGGGVPWTTGIEVMTSLTTVLLQPCGY